MGRRGPRPLPVEEKRRRGTLEPARERKRSTGSPQHRPARDRASWAVVEARDFVSIADAYAHDGIHGRSIVCGWVRKAAERFVAMRKHATEPTSAYYFSAEHANDVCRFVEQLPHVEGRWDAETIRLQPWQVFILVACYGFRRKADGRRLVTTVFFQVARKSAKSTLVAAVALYHLVVEKEPGAQVVCGASTGQQARIVFSVMQRMVRRSSWLRDQGLTVYANSITFDETGGYARPINSRSSTQDGLNSVESHAQTFELRDVLVSAHGGRVDGMIWCPTTAGYDLTSVGYALRSTAMKILDGVIESDHTFVVLYELDPEDDWRDEAVWIKSAPMIGITPTVDYVRRYCADAQAILIGPQIDRCPGGTDNEIRLKRLGEFPESESFQVGQMAPMNVEVVPRAAVASMARQRVRTPANPSWRYVLHAERFDCRRSKQAKWAGVALASVIGGRLAQCSRASTEPSLLYGVGKADPLWPATAVSHSLAIGLLMR